ncbi:radical SAM/CxCxxxxC motif protein YfkAB [Bacillus solimangrovi]|uniref:Radical SAM/CxCxxxxC motif protein YfkAB n=1 Tax=Bacillus solimangrovi TaxID=1305675 RepID=A0A1E5LB86_9BACI|nr:radical SAM/CxCxxxxC motif protein YfkAB [Bacillus solimangrovi]OEH91338.1 radical SAM/CxCxxxxC motif protein YfkAB [Bacillus solimangrovi]
MNTLKQLNPISPSNDPWEAYDDIEHNGQFMLSNVEFTTTTLCNMRCDHCAVGYTLQPKDPNALPIDMLLQRLEEAPNLRALSITGGEPMLSMSSVKNYVVPLLKYAHERGIRTQINSNLTLDPKRYELITPYLDVLHISHNWGTLEDFHTYGFANMKRKPTLEQSAKLYEQMIENSKILAKEGVFVSAETMLNQRTLPHLEKIHNEIIEMGCSRHEVHPMYPVDFADNLPVLSLEKIRTSIHHLLDIRDKSLWMLFGTLPFYPCSNNEEDLALQKRLYNEENVTVRNDPDGRSRLNISIFTGDITVTDFGDIPPLGNIKYNSIQEAFDTWLNTKVARELLCHCPSAKCLGPNILVKHAYYPNEDFTQNIAQISR